MRGYSPMRWTSAETAAAFRELYERRRAQGGDIVNRGHRAALAADFRALVLTKVGRLVPKLTHVIHRDVEDEWGEVCMDRVRRALRRMLADGEVVRTADGYLLAPRRSR